MKTHTAEFPKHPFRHIPQRPQQPEHPRVQPSTVFVYERQGWEYRIASRKSDEQPLGEDELNALGNDGWELIGVVPLPHEVRFFFKRARS
jgi:hypothetical protein